MRLFLFRLAGILVPLFVLSQVVLPWYAADRVEGRLTENGGTADVSVSAFPAVRLIAGHGDRLYVKASGLDLDLEEKREKPFDRMDKFDDVTIAIADSRAGPFRVRSFFLDRTAPQRYRVFSTVTTSLTELGRYAGERLGGSFGGLLSSLAASALGAGGGGREIPANVRATVDSSGAEPRTVDAQADVGGLPAGSVALLLTDALLSRL